MALAAAWPGDKVLPLLARYVASPTTEVGSTIRVSGAFMRVFLVRFVWFCLVCPLYCHAIYC
jgi:hypothetical protein